MTDDVERWRPRLYWTPVEGFIAPPPTAGERRARGERIPANIGDEYPVVVEHGTDPDGEEVRRVRALLRPVPRETAEQFHFRLAIIEWGRAIRERYECGVVRMCGATCGAPKGHAGPCPRCDCGGDYDDEDDDT